MAQPPTWRKLFDLVERQLGRRLETAVQTPQFAEAMVTLTQLQREMTRRVEQGSRRLLHAANLPAGSDLKRLSHQVADLDRRLRQLDGRLDEEAAR